ncbi:hypothetical protein ACNHUS_23205 [Actinomycetes bacterium M1A6_2h]
MLSGVRNGGVATDAAVVAAVVAAGIAIAGATAGPRSADVSIPGCAEVVQLDEQERINFAFSGGGGDFGGSVEVPWATRAGADAMSDALSAALPPGSVVEDDHGSPGLRFVPLARGADGSSFGEDASTFGTVVLDGRVGAVSVSVGRRVEPLGPCFAGQVDERSRLDDGTVVDTTKGDGSVRVIARTPDGTQTDVTSARVFTLDQVLGIAVNPGLRASSGS